MTSRFQILKLIIESIKKKCEKLSALENNNNYNAINLKNLFNMFDIYKIVVPSIYLDQIQFVSTMRYYSSF